MRNTAIKPIGLSIVADTDSYTWSNPFGGMWETASNWYDATVGSPVIASPGAASTVTISGGAGDTFTNIAGTGATAQLSIVNEVILWGTVAVGGSLTLLPASGVKGAATALELDGGAMVTTASLNIGVGASLVVGGTSSLKVSGTSTLTDGFLLATNASTVQLGGLIANGFVGSYGLNYGTIAVDDNASLEIGTAGGAAAGAITVDRGQSVAICGTIDGNLVVNGTLGVQAGSSLVIDSNNPFGVGQGIAGLSIGGTGTLVMSQNSQLQLGVADSAAIRFAGPGGTLILNAIPSGTISGFVAGDIIELIGLATGLRYTQSQINVATLSLSKGGKAAGSLTLGGIAAGSLFHLRVDAGGNGFISVQSIGTAPVLPTLITGTAGYDTLTAIANNQTLTGLGGNDSLSGGGFTGIDFKDTSANLNGGTISSFAAFDVIDLTDLKSSAASASFKPAVYGAGVPAVPGKLMVTDGTHSATIAFSPSTILPSGYWTVGTDGGVGSNLKYNVINTDAYTFSPALGGSYTAASNWFDTTIAITGTVAPGYGSAVTLAGGAAYMDITGTGNAGSLTTGGSVLLLGNLSVGTVIPGFSGALAQAGTLALDGGAIVALAGAAAIAGVVEVGGAGKLTVAGTATFTSANAALVAVNGGSMRFAGVNTMTGITYVPILYAPSVIGVDTKSSIEFGTAGNAQSGAVTIDSGVTANFGGTTIDGNVVVNGTLATTNGALAIAPFGSIASPSVSGSGTLLIGSGGTLTLAGSDSAAILFSAPAGGTLALASTLPTATIAGFASGDAITLRRIVTGLGYSQTGASTGTLTLLNGNATIGTLTLAGTYAAQQFQVQVSGAGGSSTITYAATPNTVSGNQISNTADGYGWINTSGGAWSNASNWTDITTGKAAVTAPGAGNAIVIQDNPGSLTSQIISGPGAATSLAIYGSASTAFTGNVAVAGQFYLGSGGATGIAIESGAQFSVGNLADYSSLQVSGGSTLIATGLSGGTEIAGSLGVVGGSTVKVTGSFDIGSGIVAVDATSVLEYGAAGGAAAGALTIDSGQVATLEENGVIAAKLVVNGTLVVSNGLLEGFGGTTGSIGGSGTIQIGGAIGAGRLILSAADSAALLFNPAGNGTLEIRGPLPAGTISGFIAGDTIQIDQTVTGISFRQTTSTKGALTLTNGAATVGTLTVQGNYTASLFQVDTGPTSGFATISLQTATTSAGTAAANTGKDAYAWTGASGGSWTKAANWTDTTTTAIATTMPGSLNAVTIMGNTGAGGVAQYTTIGGNGAAASLSVSGNVLLTGQIAAAGQLSITPASGQFGTLALTSGAKLTAASAAIAGTLQAGGGSSVTLAANVSLANGTLLALNGSTVQMGGLLGNGSNVIAVDASSVVKIGTVTNAAAGALTVAAGTTAALTGSIYGNVVANGTLAVAGGGALFIDMTGAAASDPYATTPVIGGSGTLSITEGSTLGLGAIDSATIQFAGPNATLVLAAIPTGTIRGFVAGDSIQVDQTVTGLSYTQLTATTGSLALSNGLTTVGTLKLAGNYGSLTPFHLDAAPNGATAVITLQTLGIAATQPTLIQGTMAADLMTATASGQTLTGLGGGDTLGGGGFSAISFKDLSANMNGDTVQGFVAADWLDFTDMNPVSATANYANGNLSVTDGTHTAMLGLAFATIPATGGFHVAGDGTGGTKLTWA